MQRRERDAPSQNATRGRGGGGGLGSAVTKGAVLKLRKGNIVDFLPPPSPNIRIRKIWYCNPLLT